MSAIPSPSTSMSSWKNIWFCDQPRDDSWRVETIPKEKLAEDAMKVYRCKKRFRCLESFSAYFDNPPIWKLITVQKHNGLVLWKKKKIEL